jgi:hypothetical protein
MVGDSGSGPHHCHSDRHDKGCSGGWPLLSSPPAHACERSEYRVRRGCCRGGHVPGPWRPSYRRALVGGRMQPSQAFPHCARAGGRMRRHHGVPMMHAGWHCVVKMLSSPPAVPSCA